MSIVHVFPDAEAMELHLEGVVDRAKGVAEFLKFGRFEIYGSPSESVLQVMKGSAEKSGVTLSLNPQLFSGYIRLESG